MIHLPLFDRLEIDGYGMYPGTDEEPGLQIAFEPGLTLVLGVNGLGKTTLIQILYRMCTGPYEISGLPGASALGSRSLDATKLKPWDQHVFARRVADGAVNASATLKFSLGASVIEVTRRLSSLAVSRLTVDGEDVQSTDDKFHDIVRNQSGLPSFGDWILILRYLVFYFEDRQALVWDASAQRQVLRLLLLPTDVASAWADKEREVLGLDSRVRNLQNALNREERLERAARSKARIGQSVIQQLHALEEELQPEVAALESAAEALPAAEEARQQARLRALNFDQDYDAARLELEQVQLRRIAAAFPSGDETGRYLVARLLSTGTCQTCGTSVPDVAAAFAERLEASLCVICESPLNGKGRSGSVPKQTFNRLTANAERLAQARSASRKSKEDAEATYEALRADIARLDASVAKKRATVAALVSRLPPDERALREQSAEVSLFRGRLARLRSDLDRHRTEFEDQVRRDMEVIANHRGAIIDAFSKFAEGFLFEVTELKWDPDKARVGQMGPTVSFPAFGFEMGGSDFPSPVPRKGPDQVSESQREFIDLAFRMTLMSVASEGASGSLVVDAPESSLDAVFSERAATVLARFGSPDLGNRVITTSNLVDGQLIPKLLAEAGIESADDRRIVDLLEIATPTRAVTELLEEYRAVRDRLFAVQEMPG